MVLSLSSDALYRNSSEQAQARTCLLLRLSLPLLLVSFKAKIFRTKPTSSSGRDSHSVQKATYLVVKLCETEAVEHRGT